MVNVQPYKKESVRIKFKSTKIDMHGKNQLCVVKQLAQLSQEFTFFFSEKEVIEGALELV